MGCKAAVQALQKADLLKVKVSRKCDLLNDSEAWTDQQQLQTIYHQVLVLDLEYALDKKVEQELWTLGFKNHITTLQVQARDKKNPRRSESQVLLSWCLEAASGFYLTLLQELCSAFDLDLPFRKRGVFYGQTKPWNYSEQLNPPQTSSCIYICQYCLVHLGDIARYRNQRKQAGSFYKHAIQLSPTSGQPYNQLALLEASQGDKLATVFYYVRGIAVKHPFPAAATNLANTLSAAIDKDDPITEIQTKMTVNDFIKLFLKVHGLLHTTTELEQAELCVRSINATLTALVATQSFTDKRLIQMTVINLYALRHTVGAGTLKTDELTEDEVKVRELILDLLAGSLSAFLLPVYTLQHNEMLLDYYALPAIKIIFYWIQKESEVLQESVFSTRLQIWPSLCKLLNSLQPSLDKFDYSTYEKVPLSEDKDLLGFLPMSDAFKKFDFKTDLIQDNPQNEKLIRAKRLLQFGTWLTTFEVNNAKLINASSNSDTSKENLILYEPGCMQPDPTSKLLEEMKSFNFTDVTETNKLKSPEKRGGILKPQGSLEKSREEREHVLLGASDVGGTSDASSNSSVTSNVGKSDTTKIRRVHQNVALQSIYKKIEENKQVKFSVEATEKEKSPKFTSKPSVKLLNTAVQNQSTRTSAINQNLTSSDVHRDFFKTVFPSYPNIPFDRSRISTSLSAKDTTVVSDLNKMQQNMSFPGQTPQSMFNSPGGMAHMGQNPSNFQASVPQQGGGFNIPQFNQMPPSYQNTNQFQQPDFNAWKQDAPPATWWSNNMNQPQTPNFQQPSVNQMNPYQQYPNNMPYNSPNMDFGKQLNNHGPNMSGSPWSTMPNNAMGNQAQMGYDNTSQGLSLRQAMLKETPGMNVTNRANNVSDKTMHSASNMPGYSLFDHSSWSPNLPGQFKNPSPPQGMMNNMTPQSFFSGQGPNSLQQLLEQQNQIKRN